MARFRAFLGAIVGLALPMMAAAETREVWTVGSMEGFAPYNYSINGVYAGIDVQILEEAAKEMGVQLEHYPLPWKRALLDFEAGNLDAVFQLAPTDERYETLNMVGPLRLTRTVFVTRADSAIKDIGQISDLDGLVVGVVAGFTYDYEFDLAEGFEREESADDFANLRKLLLGRADVIIGGETTLEYASNELKAYDKLNFLPTALTEQSRYIAFRKGPESDVKAARLQKTLNKMHASGRVQDIIQSYRAR